MKVLILKVEKITLMVLGSMCVLYALMIFPIVNLNMGIFSVAGLGVLFIGWGIAFGWIKKNTQKGFIKWLYFGFKGLVVGYLSLILVLVLYGGGDTVTYEEDALIILGAGLRGETVSLTLKHRLDSAIEYYEKNPKVIVVVSGGQGPGESITEAEAMKRYLVVQGVPFEQILLEKASTNTFENFVFSKKVLDQWLKPGYKVAFITNYFHLLRAQWIADKVIEGSTHKGADLDGYLGGIIYTREALAIVKWLILGK